MKRRSQPDASGPRTTLDLLDFAYVAHAASRATKKSMFEFASVLGRLSGLDVSVTEADGYEKLARLVQKRTVDLAWLPPIPFLALDRHGAATPLVCPDRGGSAQFHCVLIVRAGSRIRTPLQLKGKRAAWVDALSASGYVVPRIQLAALGIDPRTAFAGERFFGSHEAVVRAVVGGKADFGATYARADEAGVPVRGAWTHLEGADEAVRALCTFGAVPGDVIAARAELPSNVRFRITRAFIDAASDTQGRLLMGELFGVDSFRPWTSASYDLLRSATTDAAARGLLEGSET